MALTRETLLQFLRDSLQLDISAIDAESPLFSSSLIDSFSLVDLILFIEAEAGIAIDPMDVSLDNLDTVQRILDYAEAKTPAPQLDPV